MPDSADAQTFDVYSRPVGPSLYDLLRGRVAPAEWAADLVRVLAPPELERAHGAARTSTGDPWEEMAADLRELGFGLRDFREAPKTKRGARKGSRPWEQIHGTLFHQTAADIDDAERCTAIPAHALVTETDVGIAHPPTAYLYHAHKGNRNFNGIEISCRAAGIEGDPRTFWRSKRERKGYVKNRRRYPPKTYEDLVREATDGQLAAAVIVTRYWQRLNSIEGYPHKKYAYHRNTHSSRVSDPGSRIARYVRAPMREMGMEPISKLGTGKLTPQVWGGEDGIAYSWRVRGF